MTQYKWKKTAPSKHGVSAADFGAVLESLGDFSPRDIVDAARPEDSTIHPLFEWRDDVAAEEWRGFQARHFVKNLVIEVAGDQPREVNAFTSVKVLPGPSDRNTNRFRPIGDAMADPDTRVQVIDNARRELLAWRTKYDTLCDVFGGVFEAIAEVEEESEAEDWQDRLEEVRAKKDKRLATA